MLQKIDDCLLAFGRELPRARSRNGGVIANRHLRSFEDDGDLLKLDGGGGYTTVGICLKSLNFALKMRVSWYTNYISTKSWFFFFFFFKCILPVEMLTLGCVYLTKVTSSVFH